MKTIAFCLLLWVSSGLVWAGALQGTVSDSRGNPIEGAEIRIEGKNGNLVKATKSDARGHYFSDGLAIGTDYRLTLIVDGSIKASLLNVRAGADKPAELSFYLRPGNRSANKHMVWIPDQPAGTHVGAGHWAELDENGRVIERHDNDVVVMGREYARQLEMSGTRPML
ncbi:MAG TPA: carboxypeptidase-like regulatory domain-containing protein [Chthoniobacterales bacterium]|nr:carboxypeptidase-like regulatory domain-containing protein [Chthoniobacterales bacterium]